jgi:hypothetical protein
MIVEWWFPMHLDKTLAHLQRTVLLCELGLNLTLRELENDLASLRCTATSIATDNRHRQFEFRVVGSQTPHELCSGNLRLSDPWNPRTPGQLNAAQRNADNAGTIRLVTKIGLAPYLRRLSTPR